MLIILKNFTFDVVLLVIFIEFSCFLISAAYTLFISLSSFQVVDFCKSNVVKIAENLKSNVGPQITVHYNTGRIAVSNYASSFFEKSVHFGRDLFEKTREKVGDAPERLVADATSKLSGFYQKLEEFLRPHYLAYYEGAKIFLTSRVIFN
jgi:hypothetical protein